MAKKLWGGRFSKETNPLVEEFTRSIQYDYKLAEYDLLGSMIHVEVLRKAGYLSNAEANRLYRGLCALLKDVQDGTYVPNGRHEDIHTDIQNKLEKKVGVLVEKLHTARSRNDQVVFATKLYAKMAIARLRHDIAALESAFDASAEGYRDMIVPGFTHMQHAQPVYLKDWLRTYIEMLRRDNERLEHISSQIRLTMGAGAIAGTPIPAKMYQIKIPKAVNAARVMEGAFEVRSTTNPIDAVSDRDFVIDILSALAMVGMHLSRISEDLILWSTKEFEFMTIDDSFCTGSSLMPQKKNADVLELTRGYAGRLYGNLMSMLVTMKGLPLSYNRDMQCDKEPLFDSVDLVSLELRVFRGLVETLRFNEDRIAAHLKDESLYATDLVYYLVGKGVAFKSAHTIIGKLVKHSAERSQPIRNMTDAELKEFSQKIEKRELLKLFDPEVSVRSKRSIKRDR